MNRHQLWDLMRWAGVAGLLAGAVSPGAMDLPHDAHTPLMSSSRPKLDPECEGTHPPGFMTLNTRPWTVVRLDGRRFGSTPIFKERLLPGPHTLTLINEEAGVFLTEKVEIESGKLQKFNMVLLSRSAMYDDVGNGTQTLGQEGEDCGEDLASPGYLTVEANPWAVVNLDGRKVGSTPLFKHPLKPGSHVVRLKVADGTQKLVHINIDPGETLKLISSPASEPLP